LIRKAKSISLYPLTFDDGPNEPYTLQLLELLSKHGAKATFFVLGKYVRYRPGIVREIIRAGHAVGNHSYTHRNLSLLSDAEVRQELEGCSKAIENATSMASRLFRPPFGLLSEGAYRVACEMGLQTYGWSVTTGDFEMPAPETIVDRVSRQVDLNEKGEIVLLHEERNHQGKDNVLFFPLRNQPASRKQGKVRYRERLGGLLKYYKREAE
jgi:peptidoglycan/xylan/chitin deacetylase (PgdA/CDA1 family)